MFRFSISWELRVNVAELKRKSFLLYVLFLIRTYRLSLYDTDYRFERMHVCRQLFDFLVQFLRPHIRSERSLCPPMTKTFRERHNLL